MNEKILFVGIDVSKNSLDLALTVDGSDILTSKLFDNNLIGYLKIKKLLISKMKSHNCFKSHICLEATGIYNEALVEYLQKEKLFKVSVVNPYQTSSFAKSRLLRTKTDKTDAKMLAMYAFTIKPRAITKARKELNSLRKLVRFLTHLKDEKTKQKIRLESSSLDLITTLINETISHLDNQIIKTEKNIRALVNSSPKLKEKHQLLTSIPAIGEYSSWVLLSELNIEDGKEKLSAKAQVAHAGLAPGEYQSGSSVNKKPRICKLGNSRIRKALFFPTMCAIQHNPIIKKFFDRLIKNNKVRMVALIAAMRKLVVICVGVLNNKIPFNAEYISLKNVSSVAS